MDRFRVNPYEWYKYNLGFGGLVDPILENNIIVMFVSYFQKSSTI